MRRKRYVAKYYKERQHTSRLPLLVGILFVAALLFVVIRHVFPKDSLQAESTLASTSSTVAVTQQMQADEQQSGLLTDAVSASEEIQSQTQTVTVTPEEQKFLEVKEQAEQNCTNTQPDVTDPSLWQQNALEILGQIENDPYYQNFGVSLDYVESFPYLIAVNRAASTVTIYSADDDGRYTVPYMAMVCSGGNDTPLGYYQTPVNYQWRLLSGPCYGQYATRIWDAYLFHSVPYYTQHKDDLEYIEYNKLGSLASLGCIRLQTVDVKWIFDHCPIGTKVIIYDDEETPGPMGKPGTIFIDPENEQLRGWDPTDPDPENPWDEHYRSGTAIRSEEAWQQYNQEMDNSAFVSTINPTDLQGWNHDYTTEGTRG